MDIKPEWFGKRIRVTDTSDRTQIGLACYSKVSDDDVPDMSVLRLKFVGGYTDYAPDDLQKVELVELGEFEGSKRDIGVVRM